MKLYIGSGHAGFELKRKLIPFIKELGYEAEDFGAYELDEKDDYPDFIIPVARAVSENPDAKGIILGGSGQGEAIVANRFSNVRAAVYYGGNSDIVKLSREHNDANILSLGARFMNEEEAKETVKLWLETLFSNAERHKRRIGKIDMQDGFDEWNTEKRKAHLAKAQPYFKERDIFYIRVGYNIGVENNGKGENFVRPVVIIKKFNKHMFLGVPLTTKVKKNTWYHFLFNVDGTESAAIISQIRILDSKRIDYKMGVMSSNDFELLKKTIGALF